MKRILHLIYFFDREESYNIVLNDASRSYFCCADEKKTFCALLEPLKVVSLSVISGSTFANNTRKNRYSKQTTQKNQYRKRLNEF